MTGRYLNFASFGPPTAAVLEAAHRIDERAAAGEPAGGLHAEDDRAIAAVARLTGFAERGIVLVPNTSTGLFHAAFSARSGRVLVSTAEFPANLYPWWRAAEAGLIEVDAADPVDPHRPMSPEDVAAGIRPETTVVSVSAVSFRTGYRTDLAAIRQIIGDRLLVVDAIQGMGVVDQDWSVADIVVTGGQKWLRAGWGTGFLALSDRALERCVPLLSGWTGVERAGEYSGREHDRRADARRFSITHGAPSAAAALTAALGEISPAAPAEIAQRAGFLRDLLADGGVPVVSPEREEERAGIVVARFPEADAVHARLAEAGFLTTRIDADAIRFSPHRTTSLSTLADAAELALRR